MPIALNALVIYRLGATTTDDATGGLRVQTPGGAKETARLPTHPDIAEKPGRFGMRNSTPLLFLAAAAPRRSRPKSLATEEQEFEAISSTFSIPTTCTHVLLIHV